MTDKRMIRPKFDPNNFENKWEAKITQVTMNNTADIVEITKQIRDILDVVTKMQDQLLKLRLVNDKKIH